MKQVNFNTYYVYYMDNDGQKRILKENLSYSAAVKLYQWYNTNQPHFGLNYQSK